MLLQQPWMKGLTGLSIELREAEEEGRAVPEDLRKRAENLSERPVSDQAAVQEADTIYAQIQDLPLRDDYPYVEPNNLSEILAERPDAPKLQSRSLPQEELYDRIYGGWLGRCSGCLLGQPVEGWHRERINGLLRDSGNFPLAHYISSDLPDEIRQRYGVSDLGGPYSAKKHGWINNVDYMPEDDDTNYTILALKLLEDYGTDFTSADVAECWLNCLPLLHTCTAERMAYINLTNLVLPPLSASTHNPFREWIGAQIRGDLFGYIHPGDPEAAAAMAWRDASISHVKNGIYGEMYVAAMLAAAFIQKGPAEIVQAGLAQIPKACRLAENIRKVLQWWEDGIQTEEAIQRVHNHWNEKDSHDWCHVIPNAMLVTIGLLFGRLDFTASIAVGTISGFDTDCNSATIGSILGILSGAGALPEKWVEPLHDTIKSGVDGFGTVAISDLARRTVKLCSSKE